VTWPAFASVRAFLPVAFATLSRACGARLTLASLAPRFFFRPGAVFPCSRCGRHIREPARTPTCLRGSLAGFFSKILVDALIG
jgi:hypothetical protein